MASMNQKEILPVSELLRNVSVVLCLVVHVFALVNGTEDIVICYLSHIHYLQQF